MLVVINQVKVSGNRKVRHPYASGLMNVIFGVVTNVSPPSHYSLEHVFPPTVCTF